MRSPRQPEQIGWTAFTIVELLVVIAIIGTLVAMLMPSLRRARDAATHVACQSNIRQIYTTLVNYSVDNNRWLPDAWYIMERQWTGWSNPIFMHHKLAKYIAPRSKVWFDPAWPMDESYDVTRWCAGTVTNPGAGNVDFSPANLGEGYYYIPYASSFFWGSTPPWVGPWNPANIRFGVPARPEQAKVLSCMCAQQGPTTGMIGPHQNGKIWNILWLDGHISLQRGLWATPAAPDPLGGSPDWSVLVNYAGNWAKKP